MLQISNYLVLLFIQGGVISIIGHTWAKKFWNQTIEHSLF